MLLERLITLRPHPFRLLLVLERILLGLSALKLFGIPGWFSSWDHSASNFIPLEIFWLVCILVIFGVMGLRLPTSHLAKWLYIGIAAALIGIAASIIGWTLDGLSPLLIVILLRSCLLFQGKGCWIVASLMWLVYPFTLAPVMLILWFFLDPRFIHNWTLEKLDFDAVITPDGGLQLAFSAEQVQHYLSIGQKFFLHFLVESSLSFGLAIIFVLLLVNSLVKERQGRSKLAKAYEQLYQYSLQIEDQATLQERTRIAREIHDSVGHLLTAQTIQIQNALLSLRSNVEEANTFLQDSFRLGTKALEEARQAVTMLRCDPLAGQPLEKAISSLVEDFRRITGICPNCQINLDFSLPNRIQVAVYRILEEALTNIYKHSHATEVKIKLTIQPEALHQEVSQLCLQIEDNGIGFNREQNATGFGLRGMQERANTLGGDFQIISQPSTGCIISINLLLPLVIL